LHLIGLRNGEKQKQRGAESGGVEGFAQAVCDVQISVDTTQVVRYACRYEIDSMQAQDVQNMVPSSQILATVLRASMQTEGLSR
jgi:hypothetical protein